MEQVKRKTPPAQNRSTTMRAFDCYHSSITAKCQVPEVLYQKHQQQQLELNLQPVGGTQLTHCRTLVLFFKKEYRKGRGGAAEQIERIPHEFYMIGIAL